MPFEVKRFRHVAAAIPQLVVHCGIAVSPRQQRTQPQQPDVAGHQPLVGLNRVGSSYDLCFAFLARTGLSL